MWNFQIACVNGNQAKYIISFLSKEELERDQPMDTSDTDNVEVTKYVLFIKISQAEYLFFKKFSEIQLIINFDQLLVGNLAGVMCKFVKNNLTFCLYFISWRYNFVCFLRGKLKLKDILIVPIEEHLRVSCCLQCYDCVVYKPSNNEFEFLTFITADI